MFSTGNFIVLVSSYENEEIEGLQLQMEAVMKEKARLRNTNRSTFYRRVSRIDSKRQSAGEAKTRQSWSDIQLLNGNMSRNVLWRTFELRKKPSLSAWFGRLALVI